MEVVARHLRDHALIVKGTTTEEASLFGRSAFNRFYYSAYLTVRSELGSTLADFPKAHASLPSFLRALATKELNRRRQRATRANDHHSAKLSADAKFAAIDLAQLLDIGYNARVLADYYPEVPVFFYDRGFKLNEIAISEAESWPHKARAFVIVIATALRQTDAL